ncbi:MAG: polymer-forming cytoskeletal protein [Gemmobacter sp.]
MQDARAGTGQKSVLAADLRITGVVATEGSLEIHGAVEGEVAAAALVVGHDGTVGGKVRAGQAELLGQMNGEIVCDTLVLRGAARMQADATCKTLVIESGAEVEGRFSRPKDG